MDRALRIITLLLGLAVMTTACSSREQDFELVRGVSVTMVWIPPGEFDMGSRETEADRAANEGPVHRVTISNGFWMSKFEVTQSQWQAVMGDNPAHGLGVSPNHPIYNISWNDIKDFLTQTNDNFRLPTEAEWEYAARAGTRTRFYWGDDATPWPGYQEISEYAVFSQNAQNGTAEVGTKEPNQWGLHDMLGNVWEWVEDDYHETYTGAPTDGSAWIDTPRARDRVVRGGSWFRSARECRAASRGYYYPAFRLGRPGFRLVLEP